MGDPVWDVGRFQLGRSCPTLGADGVAAVERAREEFDRESVIDCDRGNRRNTLDRIRARRAQVTDWLPRRDPPEVDVDRHVATREGHPRLYALLEEFATAQEVADEREFAETYVSNPASGEVLKGYAIVLAELGLCPFRGKIVRDAALFDPPRSKAQRAEHIISRLAFTQELWSSWGYEAVMLHRGAAVDGPLARSSSAFVSATLSGEVAAAHYEGGPTTQTAVLWRQRVPISRLLMTFLETPQMNRRFHEAEAVLIADPSNTAF